MKDDGQMTRHQSRMLGAELAVEAGHHVDVSAYARVLSGLYATAMLSALHPEGSRLRRRDYLHNVLDVILDEVEHLPRVVVP